MSFWSSGLKLWGPTRLCRLFQGTKEDFVKNRFFGFSGGFFSVFYNNYYYFSTLLGEFLDLLVETLGFDASMDDFKMGKEIFGKFKFSSVSFASKSVFLSVILAPKSENRGLSRGAAISRERSEPQASRSDARARRARAKHGKAAKRPFRAAKRRFEPRSGS